MNRCESPKGLENGLSSGATEPILGRVVVRSYGRVWKPKINQEEVARLIAVGIGALGARTIQILSRTQPDLSCHEIRLDPQSDGLSDMEAMLNTVRTSDLLFIVSGFDDAHCEVVFREVAAAARETGVPTIGVVPDNQVCIGVLPFVTSMWPVSYRSFGGDLARVTPSAESRDESTGYALGHIVSTMADLLTHKGFIGIDYDDAIDILKSRNIGRLGVGVASGQDKGPAASTIALGRLCAQGCSLQATTGMLACVSGSTLLTMKEFDDASNVLHESVPEDTNIIVGLLIDEALGNNMRVTVMALSNEEDVNTLI